MTNFTKSFNKLRHNLLFGYIVTLLVFVLDIITPSGSAVWIFYLIPVLLIPYKRIKKRDIYIYSGVISFLILIGYYANFPSEYVPIAVANRIMMVIMLWLITFFQVHEIFNELRRNQQRFEKAEALAHVGSWVMNSKTEVMELSDEMIKILGLENGQREINIKDYYTFIHPEDRSNIVESTSLRHKEGKLVDTEYRIVRPDGSTRYIHGVSGPSEEDNNEAHIRYGAAKDLTERKTVEITLAKERELFEGIFSSIPVMLTIFDPNLQRFTFNEALHKTIGWTLEDAQEDNFVEKVYPDPEERREVSEFMQSLEPGWKEFVLTAKDGRRVESSWSNIKLSDNTLIGIGIDISQIKKTERELEQQRQLLGTIVANIPVGVFLLRGKDLTVEVINSTYQAIAPGKAMLGKKFRDIWPEVFPLVEELYKEVLETGKPYLATDKMYWIKRSTEGPLEKAYFNFSLIRVNLPGKDEWGILNTTIETTERVKANEALIESESRLREAQKLAHIGSFKVDYGNNNKVEGSDELFRIFGKEKNQGSITIEDMYNTIHPEDLQRVREIVKKVKDERNKMEADYRVVLSGKTVKYLHSIFNPVCDSSGKLVQLFGTTHDITASMKQQQLLSQTMQKLERSNEELQQFAYAASHDLQEPLRMVSSYMTLLEKKYGTLLDNRAKQFISFAVDGSKRMSNLIRDLLTYSRVTSQAEAFKEVDLNKIYIDVKRDLQMLIRETGAKVSSTKLPILKADPTQMHQLLQNLIGNAIKFHGSAPPEVTIRAREIDNGWLLSIKDNGIGISSQFYEKIFLVFQRLHEQGKYPGTGIGLAVCKKIVDRHGGRIWVESIEGKGTTFYFTISENNSPADAEKRDDMEIMSY